MVKKQNSNPQEMNIQEQNQNKYQVSEEFLDSLTQQKENLIIPRSSKLTPAQTEKVLKNIQEKYSINQNQAITILTILFQQGGTTKRCDGNLTAKIFDKEIKLAEIRAILKLEGTKSGERKLARSLANAIQKIALKLEIPGNLAKKITRNNPEQNLSIEEKTWLSDFQSENEDCPENLRKLINECFKQNNVNPQNSQNKRKTGK